MRSYEDRRAARDKFSEELKNAGLGRLTPSVVATCLEYIRRMADDDEIAHSMEDRLFCAVLSAIAKDCCDDPKQCAALALTSSEIHFARWCA